MPTTRATAAAIEATRRGKERRAPVGTPAEWAGAGAESTSMGETRSHKSSGAFSPPKAVKETLSQSSEGAFMPAKARKSPRSSGESSWGSGEEFMRCQVSEVGPAVAFKKTAERRMGAVQSRFHGAQAAFLDFRDGLVGEFFDVAKN